MIQAVTFDVGGTLIEPFPSVGAVYAEVAREFGLECCPDTLTRQFGEAWDARAKFEYSLHEWFEVVEHSFKGYAQVSQELFASVYARFCSAAAWRLFDDVLPTLERLSDRGLKLAVISNWDDRLEPLLQELKLRHFFGHVTVSGKLGRHKPHAAIFSHTVTALGVPAGHVLHVGDSLREDFEGAKQAGLHAVRIRRSGAQKDDISRLTEVPLLLDSLERS